MDGVDSILVPMVDDEVLLFRELQRVAVTTCLNGASVGIPYLYLPDTAVMLDLEVSPRIRKRGFLITRRFESESSASSPKRSGGLSSRTCRRSCFVHDVATRANPSSASALIATADSATAAIFAGSRRGRNNDALLTAAISRQRLVEKPTSYVSAPIDTANAGLA
jgi:hypothetical protein